MFFSDLENRNEGLTCVIMGNGPSLKDVPRELLDKYDTFGANRVFLLDGGFVPNYYTVIDQQMIHSCVPHIMENWGGKEWPQAPEAMFIRREMNVPGALPINCIVHAGFSPNPEEAVVMGGTVTFASLQIAYFMGYTKALLVGVDHFYNISATHIPASVFVAEGEDKDHFHPDYFQKGSLYAAPEVEATTLAYAVAESVYQTDGRQIINLTPGSKLEVIERGDYKDYL